MNTEISTSNELIIDEKNFHQYFRDCRNSRPEKGDIMAKFTAIAEFVDGRMKKDIIDLLFNKEGKVNAAIQVMRKLGCATEKDSIRICKEICQDLSSGMKPEEVEAKVYKYQMETFYYTKKEFVPQNDPHWSLIGIANLDEFLDNSGNKLKMEAKLSTNSKKELDEPEQEVQ
jgi:hypothetical protein